MWMSALKPHERMHQKKALMTSHRTPAEIEAGKIFICSICERKFARKTSLTNHERSHSNVHRRRSPSAPAAKNNAKSRIAPPMSAPPPTSAPPPMPVPAEPEAPHSAPQLTLVLPSSLLHGGPHFEDLVAMISSTEIGIF